MADIPVEILSDLRCELGEGPSFHAASDTLFWFDIIGRRLHALQGEQRAASAFDLPVMASAIAHTRDDRQVLVTERGVELRDTATGALQLVADIESGNAATRSNDARVHPSGAFWIGTMGKRAEAGAGAIYHFAHGRVTRLFPEISIPNAICFSPDGRIAYFADTARHMMWRVDCDPATGLPTGEPALFIDDTGRAGGLDGAVCDADGTIWNARWGAGRVDAWSPGGRLVRSVAVPARQSSCPAFFGAKADRLAVTSALQGMDEAARNADPQGGMTFLLDLPVRGRHEPELAL